MENELENEESKKASVLKYLMDKYQDNSGMEQAAAGQDRTNLAADIGQGLEGLFRSHSQAIGGQGVDNSFYDKLRSRGDKGVAGARQDKRKALSDYLREKKGQRQETQDARQVARDSSNDEWRQKQYEDRESRDKRDYAQRERNISSRLAIRKQNSERAIAKEDRIANKKTPMEVKKEGLAVIGERAEQQYQDALNVGKNTGEYDPTAYSDFIDSSDSMFVPQAAKNDAAIEAKNAAKSWIDSYLRDESGAAIPVDERSAYYDIYFPQMGDSDKTVANKQELRKQKMDNARAASRTETTVQPGEGGNEDAQALEWANANPNDPRAIEIKTRLGK